MYKKRPNYLFPYEQKQSRIKNIFPNIHTAAFINLDTIWVELCFKLSIRIGVLYFFFFLEFSKNSQPQQEERKDCKILGTQHHYRSGAVYI